MAAIPVAILIDLCLVNKVEGVQAVTVMEEPKEVELIVVVDWTPARVAQEVRTTFPEAPELAVAVAKCESGLKPHAQGPTSDYGVMQIHAPSWDKKAKQLGYENYKTDVKDNLAMARYIFDGAGGQFTDWVCYTKGMY